MTAAVSFLFSFCNSFGQRLAACSSEVAGFDTSKLPEEGVLECLVSNLQLSPGSYWIDMGCKVSNDWTDFIYQALSFDMIDDGFYPTKLVPPAGTGAFLLEYQWNSL